MLPLVEQNKPAEKYSRFKAWCLTMIRDYQRDMNFQRLLPYILNLAPLQRWKHILLLRNNKVSNKINERSTEVKLLLNNYVAIIRRSLFGNILQSGDINFSVTVVYPYLALSLIFWSFSSYRDGYVASSTCSRDNNEQIFQLVAV